MNEQTEKKFLEERADGKWQYVGSGSERGYRAKTLAPETGIIVCGIVKHGFRRGLLKVQECGKGGPHGNSTMYISNTYYRRIND